MIEKGSRYENAQVFDEDSKGNVIFEGIRPRRIGPATGVIEHTIRAGDRLDLLAGHYYNDDRLWWRIADANPEFLYAADILLTDMEGAVILIPKGRE